MAFIAVAVITGASPGPCWSRASTKDFVRRLVQEKCSAELQHDVSPADAISHHGEEIGRQAHGPSER